MWSVCRADASHETSMLIFSEKWCKKKKKNVINQSFIDPLRDEKNGLANELISGLIWGPDC